MTSEVKWEYSQNLLRRLHNASDLVERRVLLSWSRSYALSLHPEVHYGFHEIPDIGL
jgi:hypothetical protein